MTIKFKPLNDRVLLRRVEAATTSKGGIIIPTTASEKPTEAVVEAVGPGRVLDSGKFVETTVKVGDRVLFGKYTGNEVQLDGENYLVLREEELLGVVSSGQ